MLGRKGWAIFCEPLPRHGFKGIAFFTLLDSGSFSGLAFFRAGVDASDQFFASFIAQFTGIPQGKGGIRAKAQQFLFSLKTLGHTPQAAAGGRDMQVQTAAVGKFLNLARRLDGPQGGIGKLHVGILQNRPKWCGVVQKNPPPSY